jgi:hypothetical protein
MKTFARSSFAVSAIAAFALATLAAGVDTASARGGFATRSVAPLSASSLNSRNAIRSAPIKDMNGSGGQNSSYSRMLAPNRIKNSFSGYQPSNNSTGIYAPWATQKPYQRPMAGTPYQRAGACVFFGTGC